MTVPLDQLIAFDLAADALSEGSSDEIYRRFMEAPNTVLNYLALMGTQTVERTGYGEVCAAEMVCRGIASADVSWHGTTDEFDQIVSAYKGYYPEGRIADLLTIMEEEHLAALERKKKNQAAWENFQNEKEPSVSSNTSSKEPPQKPITPSEQEYASQHAPSTGKSDVPEIPTESENTGAGSSGTDAWLEAKKAAQYKNERLPVGPARLTGEELKCWLSDPASVEGDFVPTNYVEDGNGNTAYWGYWTGIGASEQFDLYCCFADGTEAALPLPRAGIRTIEPPASLVFTGQVLTYQASFPDNLYADAYIHFAGTYTYTVDLNDKTVSLVIE